MTAKKPAKRIRSPEMEETIIAGISAGIPLRQICREQGINHTSVYDWLDDEPEFAHRFARARVRGHDQIAEEALSIADDASNDWMESNHPDNPGFKLNGEHVQRSKLRIETRLKLLAKWDPKRYGEKLAVGGADDMPPIRTDNSVTITPDEAYKRMLGG